MKPHLLQWFGQVPCSHALSSHLAQLKKRKKMMWSKTEFFNCTMRGCSYFPHFTFVTKRSSLLLKVWSQPVYLLTVMFVFFCWYECWLKAHKRNISSAFLHEGLRQQQIFFFQPK
mmetsp:Transcript_12287/g.16955  ORF Transcript_12287/g.16955 Transcript_12287/m.16955 type:complete len:115 (-) Transcript_12287:9-353(-)